MVKQYSSMLLSFFDGFYLRILLKLFSYYYSATIINAQYIKYVTNYVKWFYEWVNQV